MQAHHPSQEKIMIGAIAGDVIGSVYELIPIKTKDFKLFSDRSIFTDDSVLTVALMEAILHDRNYAEVMREYFARYPRAGFGGSFHQWALTPDGKPYNSWGNGSAMRTSAVGFAFNSLDDVLKQAEYYAAFTHNHPEGIKGAQATSAAIYLARTGSTRPKIKTYIEEQFGYDLSKKIDEIRPGYRFDISCQGTVPEAITAFLESTDFEDAIRNAVSLGGDSDTLACITGGISEAFYGDVPDDIRAKVMSMLDPQLAGIVREFYRVYR